MTTHQLVQLLRRKPVKTPAQKEWAKQQRKLREQQRHLTFLAQCEKHGIPTPHYEYLFHPVRKWRFDYAWPDKKVYLEIQGGLYNGGAHARPWGIRRDMAKSSAASGLGWRPQYCMPRELGTPAMIASLKAALSYRSTSNTPAVGLALPVTSSASSSSSAQSSEEMP